MKNNLSFKISNWVNGAVFQILSVGEEFVLNVASVLPGGEYTASNAFKVKIGSSTDISKTVTDSEMTLGFPPNVFNISVLNTISEEQRDTSISKIIRALREFVLYINNNGALDPFCNNCLNYNFDRKSINEFFCKWIKNVDDNWDPEFSACSHYNEINSIYEKIYEIYKL